MSDPIFYIVELDLPDADLDGFLSWYANVHAPHLYEAGFTVCTSYRAVSGDMSLVDIYQAPGPELFAAPSFERYRDVFAADPYRPGYIGRNRNTRTPYHHIAWTEPPDPDLGRPLSSDWVTIRRFAADDAALAGIALWLREGAADALRGAGASHIRLLRKGREAPTGGSIRPAGCLVVEWRTAPPDVAASLLAGRFGEAAETDTFAGYRLYPWPDDPLGSPRRPRPSPG